MNELRPFKMSNLLLYSRRFVYFQIMYDERAELRKTISGIRVGTSFFEI